MDEVQLREYVRYQVELGNEVLILQYDQDQ